MERIYLDNNATTTIAPSVIAVMQQDSLEGPLNPSSVHQEGIKAKSKLSSARDKIASYFQATPSQIIFTSCATEALNLTIRGVFGYSLKGHVLTSNIEHSCVYNTIEDLEKSGLEATYLCPTELGNIDPEEIRKSIKPHTKLLVFSAANGETGVKNDIEQIALIAKEKKIPLIVDGVALLGKEEFSIPDGVMAMCFSAHKFHGPKGIGFIHLDPSFTFQSFLTGGGQEFSKRCGTENLSGILGMKEAISLLEKNMTDYMSYMRDLRDHFEKTLKINLPFIKINGKGDRLVNTSNILFENIDGETLFMLLDQSGISASIGSACSSNAIEPSRVLLNMGLTKKQANSSIRFSFSRYNTRYEVDKAIDIITTLALKLSKI